MRATTVLSLVAIGCGAPPVGETIDIIEGTYKGELRDGELADRVDLLDPKSTLEVRFSEDDAGDLQAKLTFRGKARVNYAVVAQYTLEGPESYTVHGVTVDGEELWCEYDVDVTKLMVYGLFDDGRRELELDVEMLGILRLYRQ